MVEMFEQVFIIAATLAVGVIIGYELGFREGVKYKKAAEPSSGKLPRIKMRGFRL